MYGFRKCSVFARIAPGKASTLVGMFPRIERRKTRVLLFPRMPSVSCGPFFPLRKAWEKQRAWHRCAASAAEIERNRSCEGCWKTFCAPHLSLPKGLNLERGRGVEHVRERQRKDESSTPWAASAKRVWSRMDFLKPSPNGLYADASERWLKRWTSS